MKATSLLLIATLCLLLALFVQSLELQQPSAMQKLTPAQMDEGYFLMNKLAAHLKGVDANCKFQETTKNETCAVHVDEHIKLGFISQHIKFDAVVSARVDLQADVVYVLAILNGQTVYSKAVSIEQLNEPICVSVLGGLFHLCIEFSNINFNVHNNCFTADIEALIKFYTMEVKLFSDQFGWNQAQCQAMLNKFQLGH